MMIKEFFSILLATAVMGYIIAFEEITWKSWISYSVLALFIILFSVFASKMAARRYGCKAEFSLWNIKHYWFYKESYFRWPFPVWVLALPLVWLTGFVKWFALLVFDASPTALGRKFAEITEFEQAIIAAWGIFASLFLGIVTMLSGFKEFAMLNLWYAFFNCLPFSDLNGSKIFFGSPIMWVFIFILSVTTLILIGIAQIEATIIAAVLLAILAAFLFYYFAEAPR